MADDKREDDVVGSKKRRTADTDYKVLIIEMVRKIDNPEYLFKIYHYILAKYRRYCKQKEEGD